MRGDWDPEHRKRADVQKRYPDISESEWRFLLLLVLDRRKAIRDVVPGADQLDDLIRKIEQRIGVAKGEEG